MRKSLFMQVGKGEVSYGDLPVSRKAPVLQKAEAAADVPRPCGLDSTFEFRRARPFVISEGRCLLRPFPCYASVVVSDRIGFFRLGAAMVGG
jgi:hypothetical protein